MTYDEALSRSIGTARVPDGYFGATACVHIARDPDSGRVLEISEHGYYRSPCDLVVVDDRELTWLLFHHPRATSRFSSIQLYA